jgi:uncharacterized protein (TIGR00106 family)
MSVIVDLSIFPMDKQGTGLSPYVARVLDVISRSGLPHRLGPMGTAVEGEWEEVMDVVDKCYRALEGDCERIYLSVKADIRRGRTNGLDAKVAAVREKRSNGLT